MGLNSLEDVLKEQLSDLHSAEQQLVQALPKLEQAASAGELKEAFRTHLEETREHVRRIEEARGELGDNGPPMECKGMRGLIEEGDAIVQMQGDSTAKDAALIAAAQRVEHYEIAGYGTVRALAKELGRGEIADLADQTLDEESNADTLLTKIATGGMFRSGVNQQAAS